jgi:hypothetical protein
MVYALLDGSSTIGEEHLRAALALWRYCRHSAKLIFRTASGDPLVDKVLETIRQHPEGIGRWELHSSVCKHKPAATLVEVLVRLRDAGKIRTEIVTTSGRSAETWYPVCGREETELREKRVSDPGLTSHTSLTSRAKWTEFEEFVQPFQAVVASIFVNVCDIMDNVLPGLRLTRFLKRVTQCCSVKFLTGLSKRVR